MFNHNIGTMEGKKSEEDYVQEFHINCRFSRLNVRKMEWRKRWRELGFACVCIQKKVFEITIETLRVVWGWIIEKVVDWNLG